MKRTTASEARRNWFRILDEVAAGETVCIERNGRTILVVAAESEEEGSRPLPDYSGLISSAQASDADLWGWGWDPDDEGLAPE